MSDDMMTSAHRHLVHNGNNNSSSGPRVGNFQIQGRSPLDALAMLHLERCAHHETRRELNQLKKKYEVLRDEFDSGEGLSQSTSLLFSRMNNEVSCFVCVQHVNDVLLLLLHNCFFQPRNLYTVVVSL